MAAVVQYSCLINSLVLLGLYVVALAAEAVTRDITQVICKRCGDLYTRKLAAVLN